MDEMEKISVAPAEARTKEQDLGAQAVKAAKEIEEIKIPAGEMTRKEFLRNATKVAGAFALAPLTPKREAEKEPSLPLPAKLAAPPLLAWLNQADNPQQRERRGCIVLGILGGLVLVGAPTAYILSQASRIGKRLEEAKEFRDLPKEWQQQIEQRKQMEAELLFDRYRRGVGGQIYPTNVEYPTVRKWTGIVGPTWMFVPERKGDLENLFGREFTEEEISEFQANPQKASEVVEMFRKLKEEKKIEPEVVDFYQKALTPEGKKEILDAYYHEFDVERFGRRKE